MDLWKGSGQMKIKIVKFSDVIKHNRLDPEYFIENNIGEDID